ncbi:MAG: DUF1972 domain-containing protein [Bacteroidetes bacterium]|nr:DUF1972 domain-containing protein [Bacteroidota bacterium]
MKIAILGTKGIPNNYGGFEQFTEFISVRLVERGHSITVYNPHYHDFKGNDFNGVKIVRKYSPEKLIGGAANIIFDYLCLKDALKKDFDIIYEAGYHSVALSYKWLRVIKRKRPIILTNMDGLEWKRSKWSKMARQIIRKLEKIAVAESPYLISDNLGIQKYLEDKFKAKSFFIPYGADPIEQFDTSCLTEYEVKEKKYFILVARLEPENNIEPIIEGHVLSKLKFPLLIVGNYNTAFGKYLKETYENPYVRFLGGIYNKVQLDSIRHYSIAYFHGHSVGGTNPSLLEAMASQCFIIAHKNPFNESILGNSGLYFDDKNDVKKIIENIGSERSEAMIKENLNKIIELYNWDAIVAQHENLFYSLVPNERPE